MFHATTVSKHQGFIFVFAIPLKQRPCYLESHNPIQPKIDDKKCMYICNMTGLSHGGGGQQLTLSQPGGTDYAHHSTMSPPGLSDLATGLTLDVCRHTFEMPISVS